MDLWSWRGDLQAPGAQAISCGCMDTEPHPTTTVVLLNRSKDGKALIHVAEARNFPMRPVV